MSACNCCEAFPIDVVTLQRQKKTASLSKCGFGDYESWDADGAWPDTGFGGSGTVLTNKFFLQGVLAGLEVDGLDPDPEGVGTVTRTYEFNAETGECDLSVVSSGLPENALGDPGDGGFLIYNSAPVFSNEYTNTQLISNALTQMPEEFQGEWSEDVRAFQTLFDTIEDSEPSATYTEEQIQVRITHPPTATGYLKVWLWKKVSQLVEAYETYGEPVYSEFEVYEWEGAPNSDQHGINEEENEIISQVYEVPREEDPPNMVAVNTLTSVGEVGFTVVEIFVYKYSLIKDYEPDDPVLNEETFELERPNPDCESNGVPTLNEECSFRE
jgi:hypothetical protein